MDEEHQLSFHVLILAAFSCLCILLDVIIVISGWGNMALIPVTSAVVLCWICHFARIGTYDQRLYFYVVIVLFILGYYGYHNLTITDIPIILCLLIIMLSKKNDIKLIYLVALSYLLYLLENIFITHYINPQTEQIVFSRIGLGIVCLTLSALISVYFMKQSEKSREELKQIQKELKESRKENELFLSNMSHELRTPINAINGVSEILMNEDLPEEVINQIEVIHGAGRRMYRQVGDVLDFSEIQTGHFKLSNENYELISVVNDAVNTVFGRKINKKLDFAIDVECTMPKTLYGDPVRMKKLLVCLLDNAVKFTEEGGGYLYLSKREENYGINLNIDLWDTGCGIPKDKQDRLFDGSYLGDSSAERKKEGLGLGLSVAHGIVSAMQGFISIESKSGEGTHLHVTIPQEVKSVDPSFSVAHSEKYRIVCYFNREKYVRSEVGKYYFSVVEHIRTAFHLDMSIASSLEEVKELYETRELTHLYIANWEYGMDPEFFDAAAKVIHVCIFADQGFVPRAGSHVDVIYKPVFILAVVSHLRETLPGREKKEEIQDSKEKASGRERTKFALVVDDDDMNLVVAKGILESLGISTNVCGSGKLAIEECSIHSYDIVFMDYMMPEMNGIRAMKYIRDIRNGFYRDKPIVVLTANAVSGAKESFLDEGFDDFISKPIEIKNMKKVLHKFLDMDFE